MRTCYAVALGSNIRHPRFGPPSRVVEAALERLDGKHLKLVARSRIIRSAPIGPSRRTYANAAAIVETGLDPLDLLGRLKKIEAKFGRRRRGAPWSARVLDLDIILWSGGFWASPQLTVPHPQFRRRSFVLDPLNAIVRDWRDPVTGLAVCHLKARLDRKRPAA